MRIVIDLQGAQTSGSRNRGIGRYSTALAKGILRNSNGHEIILALNGMFAETLEPIRQEFAELLPPENIRVWRVAGPVNQLNDNNQWRRQAAELTREAFLRSLKPDFVLITSLFEGAGDDAVGSIAKFDTDSLVATVLYDLIPFIHRKPYLENEGVRNWYLNKIDSLRRSDLLLSISESSRMEAIDYLGFSADSVVNISTSSDENFTKVAYWPDEIKAIKKKYGIRDQFIMYTGGIDYRKNIEGLIRAYVLLPQSVRKKCQLAIVCSVNEIQKEHLLWYSRDKGCVEGEVVITGFIPEEDLLKLYNSCTLFVFPSWHEGFGLPALEAMNCGAAVIASNRSSLPEVVGIEEALFDPFSDEDMSQKVLQGLTDEAFRKRLLDHHARQISKFSWDLTAARSVEAMEKAWDSRATTGRRAVSGRGLIQRPKLACFSPFKGAGSGIADYTSELLPVLSKYYDITVIVHQSEPLEDSYIIANFPYHDVEWFKANHEKFDRILYHFGNSSFHTHMFELIKEYPGVMVLHDFFLSGALSYLEHLQPNTHAWTDELYRSHGYFAINERFNKANADIARYNYPCNFSASNQSLGIIVHSEYSKNLSRQWHAGDLSESFEVIPLLRVSECRSDRAAARSDLGLSPADYVICSFGIIADTKLNLEAFNAFVSSKAAKNKNVKFVFIGDAPGEYGRQLQDQIAQSKYAERIHITGWADEGLYRKYLCAADCAIQLRTKSRGETSAAVLDCLNYGVPTIVNANGSLDDIDPDCVMKLADSFDQADLTKAIDTLWKNADLRQRLSKAGVALIKTRHDPDACAKMYAEAIESFYSRQALGPEALVRKITELEGEGQPADLAVLATSIAKFGAESRRKRSLLIDVTSLINAPTTNGSQGLRQALITALIRDDITDYRIEPVYFNALGTLRFARRFTLQILDCPAEALTDDVVNYLHGDIYLSLGLSAAVSPEAGPTIQSMRDIGVKTVFVLDGPEYHGFSSADLVASLPWLDPIFAEAKLFAQADH